MKEKPRFLRLAKAAALVERDSPVSACIKYSLSQNLLPVKILVASILYVRSPNLPT